jgi:bifunctional DNA-binding transcriptional regulator/antitoxin component of YhaV-PrlF toxin-antitoxin module
LERYVRVQCISRRSGRKQHFITLPEDVVKALGLKKGSELRIAVSGSIVTLTPSSGVKTISRKIDEEKYTISIRAQIGEDGVAELIEVRVEEKGGDRAWNIVASKAKISTSVNAWTTRIEKIVKGETVVSVTITELFDKAYGIKEPRSPMLGETIEKVKDVKDAEEYIYELLWPYIDEAYRVEFPREILARRYEEH